MKLNLLISHSKNTPNQRWRSVERHADDFPWIGELHFESVLFFLWQSNRGRVKLERQPTPTCLQRSLPLFYDALSCGLAVTNIYSHLTTFKYTSIARLHQFKPDLKHMYVLTVDCKTARPAKDRIPTHPIDASKRWLCRWWH